MSIIPKGPGGIQNPPIANNPIDSTQGEEPIKKPQDLISNAVDNGTSKLSDVAKNLIKDAQLSKDTQQFIKDTGRSLQSLHNERIQNQSLQSLKKPMNDGSLQSNKKQSFFQKVGGWFKNLWGKVKAPVAKYLPSVANAGVKFLQSKILQ